MGWRKPLPGARKITAYPDAKAAEAFWSKQRILVISPHADDETLGCGGLLAKAKACGASTYVCVVSVGDLKHYVGNGKTTSGQTREKEFYAAMKVLKVDGCVILLKDSEKYMRLDAVPQRDLMEIIEEHKGLGINVLKPTLVAMPHPSSNQDHVAMFHAGFAACRPHVPSKKWVPQTVLVYEIPQCSWSAENFHPSFYVDISSVLPLKLKAYARHASQVPPSPHPASLEGVKRLAELRGSQISCAAAEAFECRRFIL